MRELASILAFAALLIGSMAQSRAQTAAPTAQAAVARAEQLDQQVVKLYGDGKVAEAIPLAEQSLAIKEQALGTRHPDLATSLNNLAMLYQAQGAFAKAEPLLLRALDIQEYAPGPRHPALATSLNNLAMLYLLASASGDVNSGRIERAA
jgi:tetratricopeptide (TPR) repeat protein